MPRSAAAEAAAGTPCPTTSPEENEALVRRYREEVWGRGNFAVLDEVIADDHVLHLPPLERTNSPASAPLPRGRAALGESIRRVRADFPDLRVTVEDLVAEGDTVAARMTFAGTQRGPFDGFGAPPTGRRMEREVWAFARVACSKIAEEWVLQDQLTMLRQLGIVTDEELDDAGTPTVATPAP